MQRDLATATGTDKAGIMRVVDDLERKGLAVRKSVGGPSACSPGCGSCGGRAQSTEAWGCAS
ncbi:helix-turn-helix domain-containing protein [Streptomyces sp. NPDC005708]|uniref:helix-turn-helix domain-containing protein n=1 Tax=Streptomyces sp. NPDC005708 TaxID=3154564 RepID=UPI0033E39FA6